MDIAIGLPLTALAPASTVVPSLLTSRP